MDHRKQSCLGRSGKVVKRLLLDTDRKSEWISDRYLAGAILQVPANRAHVRDQELTLCVVIHVISGAARKQERALHAPARVGPKLESSTGEKGLSYGKLRVLYSPGAQILGQHRGCKPASEFVLESNVA